MWFGVSIFWFATNIYKVFRRFNCNIYMCFIPFKYFIYLQEYIKEETVEHVYQKDQIYNWGDIPFKSVFNFLGVD